MQMKKLDIATLKRATKAGERRLGFEVERAIERPRVDADQPAN